MSIKWMNYLWAERTDLKGPELLCALTIANFASTEEECFPGIKAIAEKMRCSERNVQALIHRLVERKVFKIVAGDGRGNKTVFKLVKGEHSNTLSDEQRAKNPAPFQPPKGRRNAQKKGEGLREKRVKVSASPSYKEESFKESFKEPTAEPQEKKSESSNENFSVLMKHHFNRVGRITDGKAQGDAIKKLLKDFSPTECIACYNCLVLELKPDGWRSRVSWLQVNTDIAEWIKAGQPEKWIKENGTNRQFNSNGSKPSPAATIRNRSYRNSAG